MAGSRNGEATRGGDWLLLSYAVTLVAFASGHLAWLLWRYIPSQVAMFQGFGLNLPSSVSLLFAASQWWVRLFPVLATFVFLPLAAAVVLGALYSGVRPGGHRIVRGIAIVLLAVGLLEVAGSIFVVHSLHRVFERMTTDDSFQQSLRDFDAYRRQQRSAATP